MSDGFTEEHHLGIPQRFFCTPERKTRNRRPLSNGSHDTFHGAVRLAFQRQLDRLGLRRLSDGPGQLVECTDTCVVSEAGFAATERKTDALQCRRKTDGFTQNLDALAADVSHRKTDALQGRRMSDGFTEEHHLGIPQRFFCTPERKTRNRRPLSNGSHDTFHGAVRLAFQRQLDRLGLRRLSDGPGQLVECTDTCVVSEAGFAATERKTDALQCRRKSDGFTQNLDAFAADVIEIQTDAPQRGRLSDSIAEEQHFGIGAQDSLKLKGDSHACRRLLDCLAEGVHLAVTADATLR